MSAFFSVIYPDSIRLLTDGAVYTEDGTLVAIKRKVWASDTVPFAITGRGSHAACEVIAKSIIAMTTVMPERSVDFLMGGLGEFFAHMGKRGFPEGQTAEYFIAAWSETEGPIHRYVSSVSIDGYNDVEPFTVVPADPMMVAGALDTSIVDEWGAAGITSETMSDSSSIRERGADMMEIMRRHAGPSPLNPEAPHMFGIGGQVDLTTVTETGVTIETIHRWPDRVGDKIKPFGEAENVVPITRQQRRAQEREQRKRVQA